MTECRFIRRSPNAERALIMPTISAAPFTETDMENFLEMSRSEYKTSVANNFQHIRWKHLNSPFGASTYVRLSSSGRLIGRAMLQPRPLCLPLQKLRAACVTDIIIDREFRSPPTNFINVAKASGNVKGFDLVYHTSNNRTHPLYSKLLHFPNPFSLRAYAFPLRLSAVPAVIFGRRFAFMDWFTAPLRWFLGSIADAVGHITGLDVSLGTPSDVELEELSRKCLQHSVPLFARTNAFLKWRFSDSPLSPAMTYRVERKGRFIGYLATCKLELAGLSNFVLKDFVVEPGASWSVRVALRLWLMRKAMASKADTLFTMVNSYSSIARICAGFPLIRVPDRLLPQATPIFVRCQNGSKDTETDKSIHLTLADIDYF